MEFNPLPYQQKTLEHLRQNPKTALVADMGTGKTAIALAHLDYLFSDLLSFKAVIVAPLKVCHLTWPEEIKKWNNFKYMKVGHIKTGQYGEIFRKNHIVTVNYEMLPKLCKYLKVLKKSQWPFDTIIFDESSKMKSPSTSRFKSFKSLAQHFDNVVLLTGTPAPQSLLDLWSQYYLLDSGQRLGKAFTHYRNRFFTPVDYFRYTWKIREGCKEKIYECIQDITYRVSTEETKGLPPCGVIEIDVKLPAEALLKYKSLEKKLFMELETREDKLTVDSAVINANKLRQVASGAVYIDNNEYEIVHQEKVKALTKLRKQHDTPLLIAYNYQFEKDEIQNNFKDVVFLDAASGKKKANDSKRFLNRESEILYLWGLGKIPMLACHPASASHGLNLQYGGHILVWYSPTWSLEQDMQMNKRLHRKGQTEDCIIYRLVSDDTIDGVVVKRLAQKEGVQNDLLKTLMEYKNSKI